MKEVAEIAGVSVRTLHHYDHIGLLSPGNVSASGYRMYGEAELARLQQILFFKELDFPLQKIKSILDDPAFNHEEALEQHRRILLEKKKRLERLIHSVDQTLGAIRGGETMGSEERFKPFSKREIEAHQKKYEKEVEERWGDTAAYKESKRKTAGYSDDDWKMIQEEGNRIDEELVALMNRGPENEEVQRLISKKRQHITDYFYDCKPEIFRGLADMYVNDPRFTKNIDKWKDGYAKFLRDAMHVYCDNLDKE
ncbi:MerR family transcriptional regulator [Halobacillus dabanensis]|uniref:MerR family transcriptional regulator n=1 Tax=Halobacillus dabanensis TaxID=240302 RepID=UPI001FC9161D|nr:MerR family transcriptional regulator [Halobacillus dabanensis]